MMPLVNGMWLLWGFSCSTDCETGYTMAEDGVCYPTTWKSSLSDNPGGAEDFEENVDHNDPVAHQKDVGPVAINEILGRSLDHSPDFVELYHRGDEAIDISGWLFSNSWLIDGTAWELPDNVVLEPNTFLVLYCDEDPIDGEVSYQADLSLSKRGGTVTLLSRDGVVQQQITYPELLEGEVYQRVSDGFEEWTVTPLPTPGEPNAFDVVDSGEPE